LPSPSYLKHSVLKEEKKRIYYYISNWHYQLLDDSRTNSELRGPESHKRHSSFSGKFSLATVFFFLAKRTRHKRISTGSTRNQAFQAKNPIPTHSYQFCVAKAAKVKVQVGSMMRSMLVIWRIIITLSQNFPFLDSGS
jgi:hypothetical protein